MSTVTTSSQLKANAKIQFANTVGKRSQNLTELDVKLGYAICLSLVVMYIFVVLSDFAVLPHIWGGGGGKIGENGVFFQ